LSIYVPYKYKPVPNVGFERKQDLQKLKNIASELGKFPIYDVEGGIEVRGYEK